MITATSLPSPAINPTSESLNRRLIGHLRADRLRDAVSTVHLMSRNSVTPDLTATSVLLKNLIRTRNFNLGRTLHTTLMSSTAVQFDTTLFNSLITLYSKSGDWRKAREIFDSMSEDTRDLVTFSAMISCYATNGLLKEATLMFIELLGMGKWELNEYCYTAVLRVCCSKEYAYLGPIVFGILMKSGYFESDVCVGCALIDMFTKGLGDLDYARKVFDKMPDKNAVTWTLMITRYVQMGFALDGIKLFLDMIASGFVPDRFTFSSCFSACAELESLFLGRQIHSLLAKSGLSLDACVGCSLVDMYAKCDKSGSMEESRKVFDRIADHNVMSWTAIISGYVQSGLETGEHDAIELYSRMIEEGKVKPNHFTFAALLKACGNLFDQRLGEQLHAHAVKWGYASVNCVGNSLITMYAKCDKTDSARKAFELLFEKSLVSYNALVEGYARNSGSDEAFHLFDEIEKNSTFCADAFTFASLLSAAASVGAVGKGEQLHARSIKTGLESYTAVSNALISMYTRCGDIEAGLKIFDLMETRNVISWTSIITGHAKHGFAKRAFELFNRMLDSAVRPNEVTYIAILSACSHAGLIEEGWRHFNSMYKTHGIKPRMEHYACMVDILGRSGSLEKAVEFIESMPFAPDALIWRTLLGACRVHGDAELGKFAAEKIIEQESNDPSAHVLLANIYASQGRFEDSTRVRKGMRKKNLVKEAGCSWIEFRNSVHTFYVGDTKHPEAEEIYEELDRLVGEIRKMGYVPDTDFVLHDVDEELKEKYLLQHSEKIALAYGLISTKRPKPIRIFKNLRVCGDCHSAMKYASVASGRVIVVRDSNRFHHIKDGVCSCNDYW